MSDLKAQIRAAVRKALSDIPWFDSQTAAEKNKAVEFVVAELAAIFPEEKP